VFGILKSIPCKVKAISKSHSKGEFLVNSRSSLWETLNSFLDTLNGDLDIVIFFLENRASINLTIGIEPISQEQTMRKEVKDQDSCHFRFD
jgi:hypothetical protein